MATVSQIAAPQGRRGLTVVCVERHSAGPPRSPRKRRQFRRSHPPGRRGLMLIPIRRHSAGPPRSPRNCRDKFADRRAPRDTELSCRSPYDVALPGAHASGDSFADRSPPKTVRSHGDPRKTSLCWASQEPTKEATVSQIAAPQERRGLMVIPVRRHCAGPPRSLRKWQQFRRSQPPRDGEVSW